MATSLGMAGRCDDADIVLLASTVRLKGTREFLQSQGKFWKVDNTLLQKSKAVIAAGILTVMALQGILPTGVCEEHNADHACV